MINKERISEVNLKALIKPATLPEFFQKFGVDNFLSKTGKDLLTLGLNTFPGYTVKELSPLGGVEEIAKLSNGHQVCRQTIGSNLGKYSIAPIIRLQELYERKDNKNLGTETFVTADTGCIMFSTRTSIQYAQEAFPDFSDFIAKASENKFEYIIQEITVEEDEVNQTEGHVYMVASHRSEFVPPMNDILMMQLDINEYHPGLNNPVDLVNTRLIPKG